MRCVEFVDRQSANKRLTLSHTHKPSQKAVLNRRKSQSKIIACDLPLTRQTLWRLYRTNHFNLETISSISFILIGIARLKFILFDRHRREYHISIDATSSNDEILLIEMMKAMENLFIFIFSVKIFSLVSRLHLLLRIAFEFICFEKIYYRRNFSLFRRRWRRVKQMKNVVYFCVYIFSVLSVPDADFSRASTFCSFVVPIVKPGIVQHFRRQR